MTREAQYLARAVCCDEAAEHLLADWTDDPIEREAAKFVSAALRARAEYWTARAVEWRHAVGGEPS